METIQINDLMYDRGRGPELRSCRITVYDLVPYWLSGQWTDERILTDVFRNITADELEALKEYFEGNREAVMAWHEKIEDRNRKGIAAQDTPENRERSRQLRERMKLFQQFVKEENQKGTYKSLGWELTQKTFHDWMTAKQQRNGVHGS